MPTVAMAGPPSGVIRAYTRCAHCFTCGKDVLATQRTLPCLAILAFLLARRHPLE